MKIIKILTLTAIPFLILGCEKQYFWSYVVINETDHKIVISGYDRIDMNNIRFDSPDSSLEQITIQPFGQFEILRTRGIGGDPLGIFDNMGIDSVAILFNNEKMLVQKCDEPSLIFCNSVPRNITDYENVYERVKTGRSSGENEYRFTYTITEEDYNNALPIEK